MKLLNRYFAYKHLHTLHMLKKRMKKADIVEYDDISKTEYYFMGMDGAIRELEKEL